MYVHRTDRFPGAARDLRPDGGAEGPRDAAGTAVPEVIPPSSGDSSQGPAVGLMDALKSMLGLGGGAGRSADGGIYRYVRCNRCQDVVRVRINMASEVSEISEEPEDDPDVARPANPNAKRMVTKGVVDSKCFRPMRLTSAT